jgi:hypothetical protein
VADGESALSRNFGQPDSALQILVKKFRRASLLPGRKAAFGRPRRFLKYPVSMDDVRAEDEAELIEGQHRGSVAAAKERKDALGDLRQDQIVFEHCEPIIPHPAKPEIVGDVVEALTRNGVVDVVESAACPAARL